MVDGVALKPEAGLRPWRIGDEPDRATQRARGTEAINEQKMGEEVGFRAEPFTWRLHVDSPLQKIRLPEPKCSKAKYLLASPELQPSCRRAPAKLFQELRGSAQFWSAALPAIRPELPVIDRLLGGSAAWAEPEGMAQRG